MPGHNSVRRGRDIERRVHRECDDWCHPEAALLSADTENLHDYLVTYAFSALMYLSPCDISPTITRLT